MTRGNCCSSTQGSEMSLSRCGPRTKVRGNLRELKLRGEPQEVSHRPSIEGLSPGWNSLCRLVLNSRNRPALPPKYWYGTVNAANAVSTKQAYLVVASSVRYRAKLLGDSIAHRIGFAIFDVDGTDKQVIRDVIQMPTELEPGAGSRNVVCGALPLDLG